jgi:hypothetical protein
MEAPQTIITTPRVRRKLPVWQALVAFLFVLFCGGVVVLALVLDQTTALGTAYLRAVNSGNAQAAELLGDHYANTTSAQQQRYKLDIQRELAYLDGAELSDVRAVRGQTMSGQWVTELRFKWRPSGSSGQWTDALLYVKTEKWFLLPYIRAVEQRQ